MNILDFIFVFFFYWVYLQSKTWLLALAFGVTGRIIYIIAYILHSRVILGADTSKDLEKDHFWLKFIVKEIIYMNLSIVGTYVALFILGYSVLAAGQLLRGKTDPESHNFLRFLGGFFTFGIYGLSVLGVAMFIWWGNNLIYEFIALGIAGIFYKLCRRGYPKVVSGATIAEFRTNQLWHKMPKPFKAAVIICFIVVPYSMYGLTMFRIILPWTEQEEMVQMRDGALLRTRIYFPRSWDGTPKSIVLSRTPYNIDGGMDGYALSYVVEKGYILVVQDMRGCWGSGASGPFPIFRSDWQDGYDTCVWINKQTWSNKKIATIGGSALGINQICYHAEKPEGLRAASIYVGAGEMYEYGFMIGGCFRQNLSETWIPGVMTHTTDITARYKAAQEQIDLFSAHPTKDSFYEKVSLIMNNRSANIDVRAVHIGGWYDMFCEGTIQAFLAYNNNGTDYAKNHQFLVMGPWNHGIGGGQPDIVYPNHSDTSMISLCENSLFNEYLKGETIDWANLPRVYYYVMGDPADLKSTIEFNKWRNGTGWPIPSTSEKWYFHSNGTLSNQVPTGTDLCSFLFDPRTPVESLGGTELTLNKIGAVDQRKVEYDTNNVSRADILKFTTPKLSAPVEIVGHLTSQLTIMSNCTDTDFVVKLMDIFPDGREMWVADGILKARYRDNYTVSVLMTPGQLYDLSINMWSTAYRFVTGHQIRISVTSSLYNKFAINPNTGVAVGNYHVSDLKEGNFYIANNSIACGYNGNYSYVWFPRTL